jgi:hypothetical protein
MTTKKIIRGLRVYVLPGGDGLIAAQELDVKGGKTIWIQNPAFVSTRDNGNGFTFLPLKFVDGPFELFTGSLIGAFDMPAGMVSWYEGHVARQEDERAIAPQQ